MPYDKVVDSATLDASLSGIADAIRAKTGGTESMTLDQMAEEIARIQTGGSGDVSSGEVVVVPKTEFSIVDEHTPYTEIEIPDDINKNGIYDVYFDGQLYDNAKLQSNGMYGNPRWWLGSNDGTPFLLVADEGLYAYVGTHDIRIIKSL